MRTSLRIVGRLLLLLPLTLASGCQESHYYSESVLHSDGSIERTVAQPLGDFPEESLAPSVWKISRDVARDAPLAERGSITTIPRAPADTVETIRLVSQHFKNVREIPDYFIESDAGSSKSARLTRQYRATDYGFVVIHEWQEALNDIVTLSDIHQARHELTELLIPLVADVLQQELGKEYDTTALVDWLSSEGVKWFEELSDLYVELSVRRNVEMFADPAGKLLESQMIGRVAQICLQHGLKITDSSNQLLPGQQLHQTIHDFAESKVRSLIHRHDGKPLDAKTVDFVLRVFQIPPLQTQGKSASDDEPSDAPANDSTPDSSEERAKRSCQTAIVQKYGDQDAFAKRLNELRLRMFGLFGWPMRSPSYFHYSMTVPGLIVEANGKPLADNEVEWSFEAGRAYPFGYSMQCRSMEPKLPTQQKLLNRQPLTSRMAMTQFVEILANDDGLTAALKHAVAQQNMSSLHEYLDSEERDDGQRARGLKLLQLLGR